MIVAPATGTVVAPGTSVHVVVQASWTRVLLVGPGTTAIDEAAPFELDLSIPAEAVGSFAIKAFGASDTGAFSASNTVTLSVVPPASLQSLRAVAPDLILFGPGSTHSLVVLGTYSDGVTRDVTDASTGTVYRANRPEIERVARGRRDLGLTWRRRCGGAQWCAPGLRQYHRAAVRRRTPWYGRTRIYRLNPCGRVASLRGQEGGWLLR